MEKKIYSVLTMSVSGVSHKPQGTEGLIPFSKLGKPQRKDDKKCSKYLNRKLISLIELELDYTL